MKHTVNNTSLRRIFIATAILIFCFFARGFAQHDFNTTRETTFANKSITIPTHLSNTYNYSIDWEDGRLESIRTEDISYGYAILSLQTAQISDDFIRIFNNDQIGGDREKIIEVLQWRNIFSSSTQTVLYECLHLNIMANDNSNLINVTSLRYVFRNTNLDVSQLV